MQGPAVAGERDTTTNDNIGWLEKARSIHQARVEAREQAEADQAERAINRVSNKLRDLVNLFTGRPDDTVYIHDSLDTYTATVLVDGFRFGVHDTSAQELYVITHCDECGEDFWHLVGTRGSSNPAEDRVAWLSRFGGLEHFLNDPAQWLEHRCGKPEPPPIHRPTKLTPDQELVKALDRFCRQYVPDIP